MQDRPEGPNRQTRVRAARKELYRWLYDQGLSNKDIAMDVGVSGPTVTTWLKGEGLTPNFPSIIPKEEQRRSAALVIQWIACLEAGEPMTSIATRFGVTKGTVSGAIWRYRRQQAKLAKRQPPRS